MRNNNLQRHATNFAHAPDIIIEVGDDQFAEIFFGVQEAARDQVDCCLQALRNMCLLAIGKAVVPTTMTALNGFAGGIHTDFRWQLVLPASGF